MTTNLDDLIPVVDFENFIEEENIEETADTSENIVADTSDLETSSTENTDEVATLFFNKLVEEGITKAQEDKESYTWDDITQTLDYYKRVLPEQIADSLVEDLPQEAKQLVEYVLLNRENITKDKLTEFYEEYLEDINKNSISTSEEAKRYLTKAYSKNFEPEEVQAMIDSLEDKGEEALLKQVNKIKSKVSSTIQSSRNNRDLQTQQQNQFVKNIYQELNNTDWNPNKIRSIRNSLINGETNNILNQVRQSPKAIIQLADFASYYDADKQEFDFTKFINKQNSKEVTSLKNRIEKDMFTSTNKTRQSSNSGKIDYDKLVVTNNY